MADPSFMVFFDGFDWFKKNKIPTCFPHPVDNSGQASLLTLLNPPVPFSLGVVLDFTTTLARLVYHKSTALTQVFNVGISLMF